MTMPSGLPPNPHLRAFTPPQQALVDAVWSAVEATGQWPTWDYVDRVLHRDHQVDAWTVAASLPTSSMPLIHRMYRAVYVTDRGGARPERDAIVVLTIAGLRQARGANYFVNGYLALVDSLVCAEAALKPNPVGVVNPLVGLAPLIEQAFGEERLAAISPLVGLVMWQEPPTYGARGDWRDEPSELSDALRGFASVEGVDDYLDRVDHYFGRRDQAPPARVEHAPLALHATLDHLNTIWRLRTGHLLLRIGRTYGAGVLATDCNDQDGFATRLAALADLLEHIHVDHSPLSGATGAAWTRKLRGQLHDDLDVAKVQRCDDAIDNVVAVLRLRNASVHRSAWEESARRFSDVGLAYPPLSWSDAWRHVQSVATDALQVLVEELGVSS